ncbi:glycosyltransferase SypN [Vibrio variabilis]|uniref:Glycosyltransferase SypN n=1 Tax=Vibrio variabilis TaxID=990271 RepID=A0ABQ0JBK1_9VIBR|nr:glycosyltransferase SypN [Vibrio variabilis]
MPFVLNQQIKACNPLKLKEYLAARRPIVTTDFPALDGYRQHVNVISDVPSMVTTLKRLLQQIQSYQKAWWITRVGTTAPMH